MSDRTERADMRLLAELEGLLGHLEGELDQWRRRCHRAEAEAQQLRAEGVTPSGPELAQARARVVELEVENASLRTRLDLARERVRALGARLAFLEQGSEKPA